MNVSDPDVKCSKMSQIPLRLGWGGVWRPPPSIPLPPNTPSGQQLQAAERDDWAETELGRLKVLVEEQLGTPRPPRLPSWSAGSGGHIAEAASAKNREPGWWNQHAQLARHAQHASHPHTDHCTQRPTDLAAFPLLTMYLMPCKLSIRQIVKLRYDPHAKAKLPGKASNEQTSNCIHTLYIVHCTLYNIRLYQTTRLFYISNMAIRPGIRDAKIKTDAQSSKSFGPVKIEV